MKNILFFCMVGLLITGCNLTIGPGTTNKPHVNYGPVVTTNETNYLGYHNYDTFSFESSEGRILHYGCAITRFKDTPDTIQCPSGSSSCSATVNDHWNISLQCTNTAYSVYNMEIDYTGGLGVLFTLPPYSYSSHSSDIPLNLNSSSCPLNPSGTCLSSIVINGKTYYNVSKVTLTNRYNSQDFTDTVYYAPQYGIVKYYTSGLDETWMKKIY